MIDMLREINTLLNQYVLNLKDIYGDSLRSVILFGSYAEAITMEILILTL